ITAPYVRNRTEGLPGSAYDRSFFNPPRHGTRLEPEPGLPSFGTLGPVPADAAPTTRGSGFVPAGRGAGFLARSSYRSTLWGSSMTVHWPIRFGRRTLVGSGLAWVLSSISAEAQKAGCEAERPAPPAGAGSAASPRLDGDKLKKLIQLAPTSRTRHRCRGRRF